MDEPKTVKEILAPVGSEEYYDIKQREERIPAFWTKREPYKKGHGPFRYGVGGGSVKRSKISS